MVSRTKISRTKIYALSKSHSGHCYGKGGEKGGWGLKDFCCLAQSHFQSFVLFAGFNKGE